MTLIKPKVQSTIERYAEGRYVGDGDDLKEFQAWTKERVADLEIDIKEGFILIDRP